LFYPLLYKRAALTGGLQCALERWLAIRVRRTALTTGTTTQGSQWRARGSLSEA
jgi:hypothetical protein